MRIRLVRSILVALHIEFILSSAARLEHSCVGIDDPFQRVHRIVVTGGDQKSMIFEEIVKEFILF